MDGFFPTSEEKGKIQVLKAKASPGLRGTTGGRHKLVSGSSEHWPGVRAETPRRPNA